MCFNYLADFLIELKTLRKSWRKIRKKRLSFFKILQQQNRSLRYIMKKHLISTVTSSILQLFWIHQLSWSCIRWVFSWIYHTDLSQNCLQIFSRTQVEKTIMKSTERTFVTIIKLIMLIILQLIFNQKHVKSMLIISQRVSVLLILNSSSLKHNHISKLKIIL